MNATAVGAIARAGDGHCHHCGTPVNDGNRVVAEVGASEHEFCCAACAQVAAAIHAGGWDRFYKYAPQSRAWAPPPGSADDAPVFDDPDYQAEFCVEAPDGAREATLLVEGLHCAACVWLIEHALGALDGVTRARVNYARQSLQVRWDGTRVPLSRIVAELARFGYRAEPYREDAARRARERARQKLFLQMAFAGFVAANVMMAALALYTGEFFGIDAQWQAIFKWYSMLFVFALLAYSGATFFSGAARALRAGRLDMDVPICLGLFASLVYSVAHIDAPGNQTYFDTIVMFVFLILVGRYLELAARERIRHATEHVYSLLPRAALRIEADGSETAIPVRAVRVGDVLRIKPGERVPADGVVIAGASSLNEALLTGESAPVAKRAGATVTGGTLNGAGTLQVRATHVGAQSVLAQIQRLIEDAQSNKSRAQAVADRLVPYFVVVTLSLAAGTFAVWWWTVDAESAARAAIAVLIITCPCALGLAAPMAIAVATGLGSRIGVLFKSGRAVEALAGVTDVVFDKTGTLTQGRLRVRSARAFAPNSARLWSMVYAAEKLSEHPIARALAAFCASSGEATERCVARDFEAVPGHGVRARLECDGRVEELFVGSLRWARDLGAKVPTAAAQHMALNIDGGDTIVAIFNREELLGWCALYDAPRPEAMAVIAGVRDLGLAASILSGDNVRAVSAAARELYCADPTLSLYAELSPADKSDTIRRMQDAGRAVAMVGDGVNDAPALARAQVGVAVADAADLSATAADVVLMGGLDRLLRAIQLARATHRVIKQNLALSLAYNALTVPFAMLGWISPLFAAIAMPLSSLVVIGNALRISATVKRYAHDDADPGVAMRWSARSA